METEKRGVRELYANNPRRADWLVFGRRTDPLTRRGFLSGLGTMSAVLGAEVVSVQCTVCHSARLIAQNRSDRDGWLAMIRWMQDTQGLWPLGDNEGVVLDYLAGNYGPLSVGRRRALPPDLLPPP